MPKGVYERKPMSDRIKEDIDICPTTGCWLWKKRLDKYGYGQISDKCKSRTAHKVSYEIFKGEISEGMVCSHTCDEKYPKDSKEYRRCCNPDHIVIATPAENSQRMAELGRAVSVAKWKKGEMSGEKNHRAKLTREDVLNIHNECGEKRDYGLLVETSEKYGVQYQTIYKILRGKLWTDVYNELHPSQ